MSPEINEGRKRKHVAPLTDIKKAIDDRLKDVTYTFTPESYECVTGTGETIELTHYCYVRDGFTYIPMDFAKTL